MAPLRIVLIGPPAERDRLRRQLDTTIEIAGEFATLAAARAAGLDADGFLVASRAAQPGITDDTARGVPDPLTPRELDVLRQLALGLPNKTIAARLGISDQTVKFHVGSIIGKLGAANRTDAVRRALRGGLIDL